MLSHKIAPLVDHRQATSPQSEPPPPSSGLGCVWRFVLPFVAVVAMLGAFVWQGARGPSRSTTPSAAPFAASLAAQLSPAGLLVVPDGKVGALALIDPLTLGITDRIQLASSPDEVLLSPDGRRALVAGASVPSEGRRGGFPPGTGSTLSVVDLASGTGLSFLPLPGLSHPRGLAWANGGALFLADCIARKQPSTTGKPGTKRTRAARLVAVSRYDLGTNGVRRLLTLPLMGTADAALAASASTSTFYVLSGSVVQVHSFASQGVADAVSSSASLGSSASAASSRAQISLGQPGRALALSPDDRELWVGHADAITVIDTTTCRVKRTVLADGAVVAMRFAPGGEHVVVATAHPAQLLIVPRDEEDVTGRTSLRSLTPTGIVAVPDARRVFLAAQGDRLVEVDVPSARLVGTRKADHLPPLDPPSPLQSSSETAVHLREDLQARP